ncbi:MAG: hypothetical protein AB8H86_19800 [Polyangiales bacterium]
MLRYVGYSLVYVLVYQLREHLSTTAFIAVVGVASLCVFGVHRYLKKGDEAILKKVQASQDRYEYEQEKKALAAKRAPKPKGTYRE